VPGAFQLWVRGSQRAPPHLVLCVKVNRLAKRGVQQERDVRREHHQLAGLGVDVLRRAVPFTGLPRRSGALL
jgi:hypothetical protein